jgi:hypothetical protein
MIGLGFLMHGWLEVVLLGSGVGFTLMSLCWGYSQHRQLRAFGILLSGVAWLWLAHEQHHHTLFSMFGAACLIAANLTNRHSCKTCNHCNHGHEHAN